MTTTNRTYKGWTNYETWRVRCEQCDTLTLDDLGYTIQDCVDLEPKDADDDTARAWGSLRAYDIGKAVREYVVEFLESESGGQRNDHSFVMSYALEFLTPVNWTEIAEHIIDEARELTEEAR
jgi:hypothetical protein